MILHNELQILVFKESGVRTVKCTRSSAVFRLGEKKIHAEFRWINLLKTSSRDTKKDEGEQP
jgi:hypothetical protein